MRQRTVGQGGSLSVPGTGFDVTLNHSTDPARLVLVSSTGEATAHEGGRTFYHRPDVDGTTLQVESVNGLEFSPMAKAFITLKPVGGDETILLTDLDVGGHRLVEVASLRAVDDDSSEISTMGGANVTVPPMVRQAQLATAAALGLRGNKLRSRQSRDIAVVIDGTASMTTWLREGALAGVTQCISGVDLVVGHDERVDLRVAGSKQPWRTVAAMEVPEGLGQQFDLIGKISRVDLYNPAPPSGRAWCVVTDHAPESPPPEVSLVIVLCGRGAGEVIATASGDPRVFCLEVEQERVTDAPPLTEANVKELVDAALRAFRLDTEGDQS